jgi:hypothetical protein
MTDSGSLLANRAFVHSALEGCAQLEYACPILDAGRRRHPLDHETGPCIGVFGKIGGSATLSIIVLRKNERGDVLR